MNYELKLKEFQNYQFRPQRYRELVAHNACSIHSQIIPLVKVNPLSNKVTLPIYDVPLTLGTGKENLCYCESMRKS